MCVLTGRDRLHGQNYNFLSSPPPTGDKSLPPKLELSDSIPPLIHSDADPEPPTLKPIDAAPDCDDKVHSKSANFDGEIPDLLSSMPRLNGHSHDSLQNSLLEGDMSVVATSTLAEPTGTVNRRTAVLFRKSKATSLQKLARGGDETVEGGKEEGEKEEEDEDGAQLGSKSFLSVVIPRLETLLHKRKRKHSGGRESEEEEEEGGEQEEEGESPVKRLNTGKTFTQTVRWTEKIRSSFMWHQRFHHIPSGLSSGFLGEDEEKPLVDPNSASRPVEPRRRCASESSISSCSSLPGSTR